MLVWVLLRRNIPQSLNFHNYKYTGQAWACLPSKIPIFLHQTNNPETKHSELDTVLTEVISNSFACNVIKRQLQGDLSCRVRVFGLLIIWALGVFSYNHVTNL